MTTTSNKPTEYAFRITTRCTLCSAEYVLSAQAGLPKIFSQSITITKQERCAVCSAPLVIRHSAASEIKQSGFAERRLT